MNEVQIEGYIYRPDGGDGPDPEALDFDYDGEVSEKLRKAGFKPGDKVKILITSRHL